MRLRRIWAHLAALTVISILIVVSLSPSLSAATAEPPVLGRAWYWEDYKQQEVSGPTGTVTVETTNPFCPAAPGGLGDVDSERACAQGRLPVEIRASDYDSQNMFSAVAWDFVLVPIGSDVQSFKVTFLEAKTGCYNSQGKQGTDPTKCNNEQTSQFNAGDKVLQACALQEFFGDGEGRPIKEAPRFSCSGAPTATREVVKSKDPSKQGENADHRWTFDLTAVAQSWVDDPPEMTGIVLRAQEPRGNQPTDSNWRVVLAGPNFPNGVVSELKYIPAATSAGGGGGGFGSGGGGGSTTFIPGSPGTAGTPAVPGTSVPGTTGTATGTPVDANSTPSSSPVSASELKDEPTTTPGYVWLGILAGLVGLSMVRSIVVERATGIRPDGVLAQIKALNPGDGTTAAVQPGPWTAIGAGLSTAGGWLRSTGSALATKLPFGKKG